MLKQILITVAVCLALGFGVGLLLLTAPEWLPALCGGNCFR